ncbi:hypothetical protein [Pseudenterobacter timonensis]|uniref:hypothetical protein n=1 Tax=Pseudenterobacter timonensis TaxID=1755099 RepID=UPI00077B819C|nr:hypothetical protein [Pseudenterobacter timonensis]
MKHLLKTAATLAVLVSGIASASDSVIPWAANTGLPESNHIAAMGQDLNAQHQNITRTQEGVWAANTGSISADEATLSSKKPAFKGYPELMPHQG